MFGFRKRASSKNTNNNNFIPINTNKDDNINNNTNTDNNNNNNTNNDAVVPAVEPSIVTESPPMYVLLYRSDCILITSFKYQ